MPDPDLGPLVIGEDLVSALRESVTELPDAELDELIHDYGLTAKDAVSLMSLDDGGRLEYFYQIVDDLGARLAEAGDQPELQSERTLEITPDGQCAAVPVTALSEILFHLRNKRITGKVAKELLIALYLNNLEQFETVTEAIEGLDLWFRELSESEYRQLAETAIEGEDKVLREFVTKKVYPQGKLMYLVGKMMQQGQPERIDPANAEKIMREVISEHTSSQNQNSDRFAV
uniref:Glutamyl-tRNA b subunit n=1 Tax=Colletotrichum fructicola (strain Nara gc5) TaxID=1213859 RepID=L2FFB8_COLFN